MSPFDSLYSAPKEQQAHSNNTDLKQASSKFIQDTYEHPEARARQASAILEGCVVGGIKAIPDRIVNHPAETCNQIIIGAGTGALFGMPATINAPIVAGALAVGGTAMTIAYTWDLGQRLGRDQNLQNSLNDLWRNGDSRTYNSARPVLENSLGGETFNCAIGMLSAGAGAKASKLAAKVISQTGTNTSLAMDGAPSVVTENIASPGEIPGNAFAMVWHRDRLGYEWDRIEPETLEPYIRKAPLSERLNTIESAINKGEFYRAYDHAGANRDWHSERSGSCGDQHDRLSKQFHAIALLTRNHWDDPGNLWLDKALAQIKLTREQFPGTHGWPSSLKVGPGDLWDLQRLAGMPLSKRVDEIHALTNSGMFKDASRLANANHILHRRLMSTVGLGRNNDIPAHYNQKISDRFDNLHLHLYRMFNERVVKLVPETSVAKINEQLAAIKKI